MISFVEGPLRDIEDGIIVVEAGGIGFEIKVTGGLISRLPGIDEDVRILTYLHVTENDRALYGFLSKTERDTFKQLITVSGVGPKGALAVLDTLSLMEFTDAVMSNDVKAIQKAPGIGGKTAQRIIIELKDKLKYDGEMLFGETIFEKEEADSVTEAAEALGALGFSRSDALKAIRKIKGAKEMTTEELLSKALRLMRS